MQEKSMLRRLAPFGIRHEVAKRYTPRDYFRSLRVRRLIRPDDADTLISLLIVNERQGLVGRMGGTEARFIGEYLKLQRLSRLGIPIRISSFLSRRWKKRRLEVFLQAGFYYDNWSEIEKFCKQYLDALSDTDILGAWGVAFTWVEGVHLNPENTKVIPVGFTAPWVEAYSGSNPPWSQSLSGKKVLVVSGFADSIRRQHERISRAFEHTPYPNFELVTIRAPLAMGQRDSEGKSWFQLLDSMKQEMSSLDFDVALIAAGAFSFPLAAHAKRIGRIGIHCGGGLQLFFAVMGNRWNNSPEVLKHVNEYWVRPGPEETPRTAHQVENACYW